MTVTSLEQTSSDRITVHFDDGSELKSTLSAITDTRLFSGKELDLESYTELKYLSEKYLALNKAADILSRRLMSAKELQEKLLIKGYSEKTVIYCIEKMTGLGLINDEYYASAIVRHYSAKSYGVGRIREELHRRGIDRELWDDAIKEIPQMDNKISSFIESHLKDPTDKKQIKKVTDSLLRRGFSWEEIKSALREYEQ